MLLLLEDAYAINFAIILRDLVDFLPTNRYQREGIWGKILAAISKPLI